MFLTEPLLETVRNILVDELLQITNNTQSIRITNDERVPPYSGEEFINVYGCSVRNEYPPNHETRKEVYSLKIGITRRLVGIPVDQSAEAIYTYSSRLISRLKSSMANRAGEIVSFLDGNWGPSLINQIGLEGCFCILSPLGFLASQEIQEVGGEHFHGLDDDETPQALFLELTFGGLEVYINKYC